MDRYNPIKTKLKYVKMPISSKVPLKKMINTVHNLITFSIVFTNKNEGGGRFNPPPTHTSKLGVFYSPLKHNNRKHKLKHIKCKIQ